MRWVRATASAALALCGLIAATQASAEGLFYFGGSAGRSNVGDRITSGLITSGTVKGKDDASKGFVGYQFNRYLGLEVAYVDLGEVEYSGNFLGVPVTNGRVEITGVNYSIVVALPLTPEFSIFGKAGAFSSKVKANDITGGTAFSTSQTGSSDSVGLGVSYFLTPNVGVRAEWERLKVEFGSADTTARLLSAGVVIRF